MPDREADFIDDPDETSRIFDGSERDTGSNERLATADGTSLSEDISTRESAISAAHRYERAELKQQGYLEIKALFDDTEFVDRLIDAEVSEELKQFREAERELLNSYSRYLHALKVSAALQASGPEGPELMHDYPLRWKRIVDRVTDVDFPGASGPQRISTKEAARRLRELSLDKESSRAIPDGSTGKQTHREVITAAEGQLAQARQWVRMDIDAIRRGVAKRSYDWKLREALGVWAQESKQRYVDDGVRGTWEMDHGPEGRGFNVGVRYYFEDRASTLNRDRFTELRFALEDFIADSLDLKELLQQYWSHPRIDQAVMLEDQDHQQSMVVVTRDHQLICAHRPNEATDFQVLDIRSPADKRTFERVVSEELALVEEGSKRYLADRYALHGPVKIGYDSEWARWN